MGECCTKGYAENKRGSRELDRGGRGSFLYQDIKAPSFCVDVIAYEQGEHTAPSHLSPSLYPYGAGLPSLLYSKCAMGHADVRVCSLSPFNLVTRALCIVITKTD